MSRFVKLTAQGGRGCVCIAAEHIASVRRSHDESNARSCVLAGGVEHCVTESLDEVMALLDPASTAQPEAPAGLPEGWRWDSLSRDSGGNAHVYAHADAGADTVWVYEDGDVSGPSGDIAITAALVADAQRRGWGGQ